jgi:hypothetical protein
MPAVYNPKEIESARRKLGSIFGELRGHGALWHRTSIDSLRAILASGGIKPNDGSRSYTYRDSQNSYGRLFGAVSLFDFDSEGEERILNEECKWGQFLTDRGNLTVIIQLDRSLLSGDGRLKLPAEITGTSGPRIQTDLGEGYSVVIPWVEAAYHGVIPTSAFRRYLIVKRDSGLQYRSVTANEHALERMEELSAQWRSEVASNPLDEL